MNKIIFAAGGTGGHIYPAIAVADELKNIDNSVGIKFIGVKGKIEEKIVPQNGYDLELIDVKGFKRSLSLQNIRTLYKLYNAISDSKRIIKKFKPDIVYGTGGYVSGPVLKAALKLKIPAIIQNGDVYPGLTTKLVANKVDKVILNFEKSEQYFKRKDNLVFIQYPVRKNMMRIDRNTAINSLKLNPEKKVLLITGGSQGAHSINDAVLFNYKKIIENNIQIIWQTGEKDYEHINESVKNENCRIFKFIDNIGNAYSASDIVLCRSGISTIMELAVYGLVSVFVPYPYASGNHQFKNAHALKEKNAAELINDGELKEKMFSTINKIINNKDIMKSFSENISKLADKDAAFKIAVMINNEYFFKK